MQWLLLYAALSLRVALFCYTILSAGRKAAGYTHLTSRGDGALNVATGRQAAGDAVRLPDWPSTARSLSPASVSVELAR